MKSTYQIIIAVLVVCVCYLFWQNHTQKMPPAAPIPVAAVTPAPAPVATPLPRPRRNLAPDGAYFLLQRVAVTTAFGVVGDRPGTKVMLVNAGPPMQVTDGANKFEVSPTQVTNDLDVARRVFYADPSVQSAISAMKVEQTGTSAGSPAQPR